VGLITTEDAALIAEACADPPETAALAAAAAHAGTLAIPLVQELRARVARKSAAAAEKVHLGATSQDLADTVLMLQAKAGLALLRSDAVRLRLALEALANAHSGTRMLGRTLLQPARPITFGLKATQWLVAVEAALWRIEREAEVALVLQFGGAAGTREGLQGKGPLVSEHLAGKLGLSHADLPWHARRDGVAGLASALAILTGALGKIAGDIALMSQAEVGEVSEPWVEGRGGSSAMPHKRNPTGCQVARSAALRAPHLAGTVLSGLPQEHERGLGGWQAEAPVLADLFAISHGALVAVAGVAEGLEVHTERMAANLQAAGVGEDFGEAAAMVATALTDRRARR
jgi:3-carboxy-cis,cis-muconate cycloisomerase